MIMFKAWSHIGPKGWAFMIKCGLLVQHTGKLISTNSVSVSRHKLDLFQMD